MKGFIYSAIHAVNVSTQLMYESLPAIVFDLLILFVPGVNGLSEGVEIEVGFVRKVRRGRMVS